MVERRRRKGISVKKNQTNFTYKTIFLRENGVFFLEKSLGKYSWWFGAFIQGLPS